MNLQGSLACLLLALYLGSGKAGPLQGGVESLGTNVGEAIGRGVGDAISQGVGQAIGKETGGAAGSGVSGALGQGTREAAASGAREATGPGLGDALNHRLGEAAHALENTGSEAGRQAGTIIRQGADAVHNGWQGMPGNNGAWPPSEGHGIFGSQGGFGGHSQGNPGGPGTPWGHGHPGGSAGSFGTHSQGGPWDQAGNGGSSNFRTNAQGAVAQPGYDSVRANNQNSGCTNPPPTGSGGSSGNSGGSSSSQSGGSSSGGSSNGGGGSSSGGGSNGDGGSSHGGGSSNGSSGNGGGSTGDSSGGNSGSNSWSSWGSRGGQGGPSGSGDIRGISKESDRVLGGSQGNYQGQGSSGDSRRDGTVGGVNTVNSQASSGVFNFDTFWKNFKSKLGFINWDAINKNQVPPPSTRALLYFRRLWEDFKHNTPFFNWKAITEGADASSLQKRAGGADQFSQPGAGWQEVAAVTSKNYNYNQQAYPTAYIGQYSAKTPAKGGVTSSSSASRMQPGLLRWLKFW
ncbi:dermokine [Carlito syrichta]|uniref:Dermokine n=1 Tax=Carlito syrichta TaxID=1868482 RepID=A0A3Q0EKQ1_CARSF|nr:dermokine [Carlito syrichta]